MSTGTTATIEYRAGDQRAVIRLSGSAGLLPALADEQGNARSRHLRTALMAVPGVIRVDIVEARSDKPKRNVVVHWTEGADPAGVSQQAWTALQAARPDIALRRAFWLDDDSVPAILSRGREIVSREQAEALGLTADAKRLPSRLWPCGCLRNDAGAHRVGCPDHPEGVRG